MKKDSRFYELRTYTATQGMLERLVSRFEHHTFRFFAKHHMEVIGLWLPINNRENKLVYMLSFADQQACEKSWKDFRSDAEWLVIRKESLRNGELVASVGSVYMHSLDLFSGPLTFRGDHVFELQTYNNNDGNRELLRNMSARLHEKYGMGSFKCWETLAQEATQPNLLICLLVRLTEEDSIEGIVPPEVLTTEYLRAAGFSPNNRSPAPSVGRDGIE